MRLQRLDLLRYGHFTDRSFELPVSEIDFHIVFGPNEAGKSTALSATGDLFFGVPMRSSYGFLHEYSSMRIGGVLENGNESLEIVRRKGSSNTLLDTDESPFPPGEATLRRFLAGADRSFFERLFSLDHVRLQAGGQEILKAEDKVGQMMFAAGAGITGLRDRLGQLLNEADDLWAPRKAKHRKYYQATDKLQEAERQLRQQTVSADSWNALKRTVDAAEEAHECIRSQFERALAETKRLARVRRIYPEIRRKADLDKCIKDLGSIVMLPEDAREVFEESARKDRQASAKLDTLLSLLADACEELSALIYDKQVILRGDDVEHLHERRIEVRKGKADLLKRHAELDASEAELRSLSAELGWLEGNVDDLIARIPARVKVKAAQLVLNQRGARASDRDTKAGTLREKEEKCTRLKERLGSLDETPDVSRLAAVIKAIRERGDIGGRVRDMAQSVQELQGRVDTLLSDLHSRIPTERSFEEMQVPPRSLVQHHRDQFREWEQRKRENDQEFVMMEGQLKRARKDLRDAARDTQHVTIEKLNEARDYRDALWNLVKRKHIQHRPIAEDEAHGYSDSLDDLASAFEPATRAADELADQRFDNAEAAGQLAEMSRKFSEQQDDLGILRIQQEALTQEEERLVTSWKLLWDGAATQPLDPDAMLEWLDLRDALLKMVERRSEATSKFEIQKDEEVDAREDILTDLSLLSPNLAAVREDPLPVMLERADSVRRAYERQAETRHRLEEELREAVNAVARQRRQLASAERAWSEWLEEWSGALTELGLDTGLKPETVSAQIEVIEQMQKTAERIEELRHRRINRINLDIADFERAVAKVVSELADDLTTKAAEEAVLEIEKRLEKAQTVRDRHVGKLEEMEEVRKRMRILEEERESVRASLKHLKDIAGVDTAGNLTRAIEESDSHRALRRELDAVLRRVLAGGDGLTLTELEAECDDIDIDHISAREETLTDALRELRDQLTTSAETRSQATTAFDAVGGDDAAAKAEAKRQEALAELRSVAESYVRSSTSAMLLRWAIDRYRREKQAPLLRRAGKLFATITRGSFKDLHVDYDNSDHAYIIGLRSSGESMRVSRMSSGTADQLYLAMRIALMEDYLERADALPFLADDLFINFDDGRAGAGLGVLGELARKTQVLFFTHHSHLLAIARETLGDAISIVNLGSRPT